MIVSGGGKVKSLERMYLDRVISVAGDDLLRYYPLGDLTGEVAEDMSANAVDGTYVGSPSLREVGTPGRRSARFVTDSYVNVYSTGFGATWSPDECSFGCFVQVPDIAWWTDGIQHNFCWFRADASNSRGIIKNTSNLITFGNVSAGVSSGSQVDTYFNPLEMTHLFYTISLSNNRARLYVNGSLYGETTGLGTFTGSLNSSFSIIGNYSTSHLNASLCKQQDFVWVTRELTPTEVAEISNPNLGGVINFFAIGDSKTANSPNWTQYLEELMFINGQRWVKLPRCHAAGGWSTASVAGSIDSYLTSVTEIPKYILVNLGANDVNSGDPGIEWKNNTQYICAAIHTKWPTVPVYLTKVWRRNSGLQAIGIAAINGYIDEIVADPAFSYVHLGPNEALFLENNDDGVTYTSDGVHPNTGGCRLAATAWKNVLGV